MELRRSINSKSYLIYVGLIVLSFLLGYFLLVGIDKIENVTIRQLYFSTYTVIVQFGPMIFPFAILLSINSDYKDRNILFYRSLKIGPVRYFLTKIGISLAWLSVGVIIALVTISVLYSEWSMLPIVLFYFEIAIAHIVVLASFFGFIMRNILIAFGVNLAVWVGSIILNTIHPIKFVAYFDASNSLYMDFEKYFETLNMQYIRCSESLLVVAAELIVSTLLVYCLQKEWTHNGI